MKQQFKRLFSDPAALAGGLLVLAAFGATGYVAFWIYASFG